MSVTTEQKSIKVFCSYAREDERFLNELEKYLAVLMRQDLIAGWHDREIVPGTRWKDEIDAYLKTAQVVLFLISPDFMASDYCFGTEVMQAIERHKAGEARVIPIILRSSDWKGVPFDKLQALPTGAKPVTSWFNRDEAFLDVMRGIRKAVEELNSNLTQVSPQVAQKDFFISYCSADRKWAEWIGYQLEEAGYSSLMQTWDFRPGTNFVQEMQKATEKARRIIAVLSPDYLDALANYPESVRLAAFKSSPRGEQSPLVPVHVRECSQQLTGLLASTAYIDLVDLVNPATAYERLLAGIQYERHKPLTQPDFPGMIRSTITEQSSFPIELQVEKPAFPVNEVQQAKPKSTGPLQTEYIWHVPYHRNPFFTGREDVLARLHQAFIADRSAALAQTQIISGLNGIGKTQIAVEYAYRFRDNYQAVLWVRADTRERLVSDFVTIADLLDLPEKNTSDQTFVISAVKHWLNNATNWLLILDDVEDLKIVYDFIPLGGRGHILLTTRAQAVGTFAAGMELEKVEPKEGVLFLLRRAKIIAPDAPLSSAAEADISKAREISELMDGLPLALDQAGAYIEETACGLAGYLDLYQKQRGDLLKQRGDIASPHPEPVATTWLLSFEKVARANPAAAELLRLCAFLHPDAIPEEIITEGASELGPILQPVAADLIKLNKAIAELLKYSLVRRDPKAKTLTIHRLVQLVIKDGMDEEQQHIWAEHTIRAVERAFPSPDNFAMWSSCQRYLPQAQTCATLAEQWKIGLPEAAWLLNKAGFYAWKTAQYTLAYALYQSALSIREQIPGTELLDRALILHNLALLYRSQGKYTQAELLFNQALALRKETLEADHPNVASSLNDLAELYRVWGKYSLSEPLFKRALSIREKTLNPEHPDVAQSLNDLAELYSAQGKYDLAEPLYQRAFTIREKILGPEHPDTAISLSGLAYLYGVSEKHREAESLLERVLVIREKALGPQHPDVAQSLNDLAELYSAQGKYDLAEPLYQRALAIYEEVLGSEHPHLAGILQNYAGLLIKVDRADEAAKLSERAKEIGTRHA